MVFEYREEENVGRVVFSFDDFLIGEILWVKILLFDGFFKEGYVDGR